jgi:hypothetical protein
VSIPNYKQSKKLGELLELSVCPDLADDKWVLHHIDYVSSGVDESVVEKVILYLVDKTGKIYQYYTIDENGNSPKRNIYV